MRYVKLDVDFPNHPKVVGLDDPGTKLLYVVALCWCGRHLTDGAIPRAALAGLCVEAHVQSPRTAARKLVDAGLWETTPDGWQVVDYLQRQRSKAQVSAISEATKVRVANHRESKKAGKKPAEPNGNANGNGHVTTVLTQNTEHRTQNTDKDNPLPSAAPKAKKAPKVPDVLFDAVVLACGLDAKALTRSSRGALNGALKQLREIGVEASTVAGRARLYHATYPGAALTPQALVKHWPALSATKPGPTPAFRTEEQQREATEHAMKLAGMTDG